LDSLVLSYPKWEEDFRTAEESHMNWEEDANKGTYWYQSFWHIFDKMKEKQNARRKKKTQGGFCSGEEEQETELCIIGGSHLGSKNSEMDIIGNVGSKESESEIIIGNNKTDVNAPDKQSHVAFTEEREDIGSTLQEREHIENMTDARDFSDDRDKNSISNQSNQRPDAHLVVVDNQLLDSIKRSILDNNLPQVEAEMTKTDDSSKESGATTYIDSFINSIKKNIIQAEMNIAQNLAFIEEREDTGSTLQEKNLPHAEAETTKTNNSSKKTDGSTHNYSLIKYMKKKLLLAEMNIAEYLAFIKEREDIGSTLQEKEQKK